jgi:hypothetical protein
MKPIRRIVSGHNASGASCFIADGEMSTPYHPGGNTAHAIHDLWRTECAPASNSAEDTVGQGPFRLTPPAQGSVFRIIDLPPDSQRDFSKLHNVFASYGAPDVLDRNARHGAFHKTRSLDYAMVLEGEVWALMDEGEKLMQAGDVLIQRGTNHAWSNRSEQACRLLFVLLDAGAQGAPA